MAYGDFKGLAKRTASDKMLRDKTFNIAKDPKYNGYKRGPASMVYNFFDKKIDVKDNTYIDSMELHSSNEVNDTDPKFEVGDHVRISKYQSIFIKGCTPKDTLRSTVLWTYVINDLNGDEIIATFYEQKPQKTNQQEFRMENVIKRKGDNYISNGKVMIVHLIAGLIKNT